MFDLNYNIIHGDSKSGRTNLLFDLSSNLKNSGLKLFFLGCVQKYERSELDNFDDFRVTNTNEDYNNLKLVDVIREITETKNYNYIIVDDIDYLSVNTLDALYRLKVNKIVTSLTQNINRFPKNSNFYNIHDNKDKDMIKEYLKSLARDQKINSILK